MIKTPNRIGPAGRALRSFCRGRSPPVQFLFSIPRVHLIEVHHVLRHYGGPAGVWSPLQSEHVQQTKLKLVKDILREWWTLAARFAIPPTAHLGDKSYWPAKQHLSKQQNCKGTNPGDHDQSVLKEWRSSRQCLDAATIYTSASYIYDVVLEESILWKITLNQQTLSVGLNWYKLVCS